MNKGYRSIVILTGAGISAESGVPTFRASDGLWEGHKVEEVATPEAFIQNPNLVYTFYNQRRAFLLDGIKPNPAHYAIAKFSQAFSGEFTCVTQNIDHLHQLAGTQSVYPMHGELLKARCKKTGQLYGRTSTLNETHVCQCCSEKGNLRPHIVWFGEMPLYMDVIEERLSRCDLFIAIGTSGHVYPAAGFVEIANHYGAHTVEINLENSQPMNSTNNTFAPAQSRSLFKEHIVGPASSMVPEFLDQLLNISD